MAINPILQRIQQSNINNIQNVMNMVRSSGNPQAMLMQMAKQNPQVRQAMDIASKYGNPKEAFYAEAQKRGIDPNTILNQLK